MKQINRYIKLFDLQVASVHNVPESFSSEVYRILLKNGEEVILKIPYSKVKLQRELYFLKLLKDRLPVPGVIQSWEGDDTLNGALLLSFIDGLPIEDEINHQLAYQMGELLGRLHSIPMEEYNLVKGISHDWWLGIKTVFDGWIAECTEVLSQRLIQKCQDKFADFYRNLPPATEPCVTHMDYRPGNILIKQNKIVGLIDFESTRGGSADADFTKVKLYVWDRFPGTKAEFIRGYQSIRPLPNIERILPFYQFYNAVGGIAWCVRRNALDTPFYIENVDVLNESL